MKSRFISTSSILTLIAFGSVCVINAQVAKDVNRWSGARPSLTIVKREGWEVPHFEESKVLSEGKREIQNILVTSKTYKVKKGYEVTLDRYQFSDDFTLNVSKRKVEIAGITSISIDGKIYALLVNYSLLGTFEDENGKIHKAYIGPLIQLGYSDEDGDGRFETQFTAFEPFARVPKWAIKPREKK